jgi:hypothetical protein
MFLEKEQLETIISDIELRIEQINKYNGLHLEDELYNTDWQKLLKTNDNNLIYVLENGFIKCTDKNKYMLFHSCRRASFKNRKIIIKFIGYEYRTQLLFESVAWFDYHPLGDDRSELCYQPLEILDFCLKEGADVNRLVDGRSLYELHDSDRSDILLHYKCQIDEKRILVGCHQLADYVG